MADFGLRIGIGNQPVESATPEQLAVDTKYPTPGIRLGQSPAHFGVYTNTWSFNPPAGATIITTINHGLSYRPAGIVFIKDTEGGVDFIGPLEAGAGSYFYWAYTTTTQLVIAIQRADNFTDLTGDTRTFKYYIFSSIAL